MISESSQQLLVSSITHEATMLRHCISDAMTTPSVLWRPRLFIDGNQWCALYGDDLQSGVSGFGPSPAQAMAAFDAEWYKLLEANG